MLATVQGHRAPCGRAAPGPNRSSGRVRISGSGAGTRGDSTDAAGSEATAAGCSIAAGTGAGAGSDGGGPGVRGGAGAAVPASEGGSWALRVANASNTFWQRPQRTWPLEAWSCSRTTRKWVSQCGQRVYMLIGRSSACFSVSARQKRLQCAVASGYQLSRSGKTSPALSLIARSEVEPGRIRLAHGYGLRIENASQNQAPAGAREAREQWRQHP